MFGAMDELRTFVDGDVSIRRAYAHFITAGDVLTEMMSVLAEQKRDFADVISAFLQKELLNDQFAKLQSAGQHFERQTPLSQVFVDLPAAIVKEAATAPLEPGPSTPHAVWAAAALLEAGSMVLRRTDFEPKIEHSVPPAERGSVPSDVGTSSTNDGRARRFVVVGGPGQGKSTLGQYLCQLYRAAILSDRALKLTPEANGVIAAIAEECKAEGRILPTTRRFPIRVVLDRYAAQLAKDETLTLLRYFQKEISRLGSADCTIEDLKRWLAEYPWLIVLDGLALQR